MNKKTMALRLAVLHDDITNEEIAREVGCSVEEVNSWIGGGSTIKKEKKNKNISVDVNAKIDVKIVKE